MRIKENNYYVILSFMVTELKLKGIEKDIYAIIYGFCQNEGKFTGSLQYLIDWTCSSKQGVINALNKLIDKNLIIKNEVYYNNVKFVEYVTTELTSSQESRQGDVNKLDWGSQQSRPNNIDNNIINNIKKESKKEESFDDIINSMCQNEELKNTLYDFIKMRKVIKKPLTNRALKSIINKVKKLSNGKGGLAIAILDQSITNCWQDVYELRNNNNNTQVKEPKQDCPYDVKKIGLHFD